MVKRSVSTRFVSYSLMIFVCIGVFLCLFLLRKALLLRLKNKKMKCISRVSPCEDSLFCCVFHAIGMDALNTCLPLTTFKSFTLVNEKNQLESFMLQLQQIRLRQRFSHFIGFILHIWRLCSGNYQWKLWSFVFSA